MPCWRPGRIVAIVEAGFALTGVHNARANQRSELVGGSVERMVALTFSRAGDRGCFVTKGGLGLAREALLPQSRDARWRPPNGQRLWPSPCRQPRQPAVLRLPLAAETGVREGGRREYVVSVASQVDARSRADAEELAGGVQHDHAGVLVEDVVTRRRRYEPAMCRAWESRIGGRGQGSQAFGGPTNSLDLFTAEAPQALALASLGLVPQSAVGRSRIIDELKRLHVLVLNPENRLVASEQYGPTVLSLDLHVLKSLAYDLLAVSVNHPDSTQSITSFTQESATQDRVGVHN